MHAKVLAVRWMVNAQKRIVERWEAKRFGNSKVVLERDQIVSSEQNSHFAFFASTTWRAILLVGSVTDYKKVAHEYKDFIDRICSASCCTLTLHFLTPTARADLAEPRSALGQPWGLSNPSVSS